jgi:hypothetical protein
VEDVDCQVNELIERNAPPLRPRALVVEGAFQAKLDETVRSDTVAADASPTIADQSTPDDMGSTVVRAHVAAASSNLQTDNPQKDSEAALWSGSGPTPPLGSALGVP